MPQHSAPAAMPEAPFSASAIAAAGDEPDALPSLLPPAVNMVFPSDDMEGCAQIWTDRERMMIEWEMRCKRSCMLKITHH